METCFDGDGPVSNQVLYQTTLRWQKGVTYYVYATVGRDLSVASSKVMIQAPPCHHVTMCDTPFFHVNAYSDSPLLTDRTYGIRERTLSGSQYVFQWGGGGLSGGTKHCYVGSHSAVMVPLVLCCVLTLR